MKFLSALYRFLPFVGIHHVTMGVLLVSIVLLSILLAGCTSENLKEICLISLSFSNDSLSPAPNTAPTNSNATLLALNDTGLEVRVSYFGICLMSSDQWICSGSSEALQSFARRTQLGNDLDPSQLIDAAEKFKDEVIFKGLLIISIILAFFTFLLLTTFPGWHFEENSSGNDREIKPFPSRPVSYTAFACVFISAVIALLAVFWQHMSSSATVAMGAVFTQGTITGKVGAGAMVLGWLSVFLLLLSAVVTLLIILSLKVLSRMVD